MLGGGDVVSGFGILFLIHRGKGNRKIDGRIISLCEYQLAISACEEVDFFLRSCVGSHYRFLHHISFANKAETGVLSVYLILANIINDSEVLLHINSRGGSKIGGCSPHDVGTCPCTTPGTQHPICIGRKDNALPCYGGCHFAGCGGCEDKIHFRWQGGIDGLQNIFRLDCLRVH